MCVEALVLHSLFFFPAMFYRVGFCTVGACQNLHEAYEYGTYHEPRIAKVRSSVLKDD